jgi:hypothetical protein
LVGLGMKENIVDYGCRGKEMAVIRVCTYTAPF